MERDGGDLEAETHEHEQHAEAEQPDVRHTSGRRSELRELLGAREAVQQRHSEQRERERKHPDDEELERSLVRLRIALAPTGQQEAGYGHQLESDDQGDEVT